MGDSKRAKAPASHSLEGLLQALCFLETGSTWVPKLPWDHQGVSKRVEEVELLPEKTKEVLSSLLDLQD